jgi:hypothetical protein
MTGVFELTRLFFVTMSYYLDARRERIDVAMGENA